MDFYLSNVTQFEFPAPDIYVVHCVIPVRLSNLAKKTAVSSSFIACSSYLWFSGINMCHATKNRVRENMTNNLSELFISNYLHSYFSTLKPAWISPFSNESGRFF